MGIEQEERWGYSLFSIKKSMLLAAVIMEKQNETEKSVEKQTIIKTFLENYNNLDSNTLTEISKIIAGL